MPFDKTSHNYQMGHDAGICATLNYVLNLINTYDTKMIDKSQFYRTIMSLKLQDVKRGLDNFDKE